MNNTYPIGTPLTFVWRFLKPNNEPFLFDPNKHSFRLRYYTGRGYKYVDSFVISADLNALTWTIPADDTLQAGIYSYVLDVFAEGVAHGHFVYNNAFTLYKARTADVPNAEQAPAGKTVNLLSVAEFHHFAAGDSAYQIAVKNGYEGTEDEWLKDPVNGIKGNGIKSFEVVGEHSEEDSATNTYRVTPDVGEPFEFTVKNGKGVVSVEQIVSSVEDSGVNTFRITLSDGTTFLFDIHNGSQGNSGYSGAAGELEVVNNLVDGGETAALSAEMGVVLRSRLFAFTLVPESELTLLGNGYLRKVDMTIMSWDNATLYYYPVRAGLIYKLVSELAWNESYDAVAFSANLPVIGGEYDESLIISDTPVAEQVFSPSTNGYVILCYRRAWKSYVYLSEDYPMNRIKEDVDLLFADQIALRKKFIAYEPIPEGDLTLLGNGYLRKVDMTIMSWDNATLYYYPVRAGLIYKLVSELAWNESYDAVAFSANLPVIGGEYDESLIISDTPVAEQVFSPSTNGYVILCYRRAWKSYVHKPEEISLQEIKKDVDALKENDSPSIGTATALKKSIVCSGSSITWGGGELDASMVKYVDKFIKERLSQTVHADDMDYSTNPVDISNSLLYKSSGKRIIGAGASVEFDLYGDEIAICQMKRRSNDYGIMQVRADGVVIGTFDNRNTIGHTEESFSGSAIKEIKLSHPCTFNHRIYLNGSSTPLENVAINTNSKSIPSGVDAWVFRSPASDGSETCHSVQFADSLGTISSVTIEYDYGRIIAHERSTVGQTDDEFTNEYVYGKGDVSYDPDQPTTGIGSGMEFRAIDQRAFFVHKFDEHKTRHYKVQIVGGNNPYFIMNFATSRYHNLMNAGIGGWELADLMYRRDNLNNWTQFFKYYHPNYLFEEAMTNDDWEFRTRRISRSIGEVSLAELQRMHQLEVQKIQFNASTGKYAVETCTGIISSITPTSLVSSDIIGTNTQVGDIVRIGNYHSDMHQITCRRISEVELTTGEIRWLEPLNADNLLMVEELSDLVGAEINIRNLDTYKQYYEDLIDKVHSVSPETKIVIVHNGLPNLYTRQLWGYEIVHAELCKENNNVLFINAQEHIYETMFNTITGKKYERVTSTGASSYDLTFAGTNYGGWQGFKVLVNGVDVYGKDAYIEMDMAYRVNPNLSGRDLDKNNCYDRSKSGWNRTGAALTLHFVKNVPSIGDTIEVQYADEIWSNDFCHPTEFGAKIYAEAYCDVLR